MDSAIQEWLEFENPNQKKIEISRIETETNEQVADQEQVQKREYQPTWMSKSTGQKEE